MSASPRTRGTQLLIFSSILFASMALCVRLTAGRVSVGQVVCARFLTGLVFLAFYFPVLRRRPRFGRISLWAMRGIFGGAAVYLYFTAIERLAVGPATLLNTCWPIYAAVLGRVFLKERVSTHLGAGLVASTIGAVLVILGTVEDFGSVELGVGAWACVVSAVLGGAAVVTVRALRTETDPPTIFLSFCLFGLAFGLPFAWSDWRPLTWDLAVPLLGVGLTSVAAQLLFTEAFVYVTAAAGGATSQLTPALSWVMGALFLGESVGLLAVAGALLSVAGILWGTGLGERLFVPAANGARPGD